MTDIKKISSKIILRYIRSGYYLWSEMDEAEAELLSRLEAGQKAVAELKTAKLDSARLIVQEEMYENLKCCGNCYHTDDGFECAFELPMTRWSNGCGKWQSDKTTRSQREIK